MEVDKLTETEIKKENNSNVDNSILKIVGIALIAGMVGGFLGVNVFGGSNFNTTSNGARQVLEEQSAVIDVVEKTQNSVVSIVGTKEVTVTSPDPFNFFFPFSPQPFGQEEGESQDRQVSAGTGFFVKSNGLIATNKHVVSDEEAKYTVYTNDGRQYEASVVARDPVNDLALLKAEGNFTPLELGYSDEIKVGQKVIAIGNALGQFSNTVTTGVVSGIERSISATGGTERSQIEGAIQTDAAINPGNSGGPLLNLAGEVLGINTAISLQGQLIGFAIPVNDLRQDIEIYEERGRIVKPFIGVRYVLITPSLAEDQDLSVEQGALITASEGQQAIIPGSPADRADLRAGDIILEIDGQEINLDNSLSKRISDKHPGETIKLKVLRGNETLNIDLELGERGV